MQRPGSGVKRKTVENAGGYSMSLTGRLLTWWMHLPPADTHEIVIIRDVQIPMPDGTILLADHYTSRTNPKFPTILIRSPYGRRGFFGGMMALPYAERGYQVLVQSCRGTAGSGGQFVYARDEHDDGLATIAWIKRQEWFSGELATLSGSYLGFVQWAVAADAGPELKALVPQITTSDFNHFRFQGGSLNLEAHLGWSTMMTSQAATGLRLSSILAQGRRARKLEQAFGHLPLGKADLVVIDRPSEHFQSCLLHGPDDESWKPIDFSSRVADVQAPVYLMGGWYDVFLNWQLKDYQALRAAGKQPYLLVGPWTHTEASGGGLSVRESLAWLDTHVKGQPGKIRDTPVRLYVMGENQWRDFADWPPPARNARWHLQPGGALAVSLPPASEPDQYRYDPADPTPAVGAMRLGLGSAWDQRIIASWKHARMCWSIPARS